ncbi:response regulator transcription factor [Crenobacter caeni]|uniref:Response regulator transcription factor n=1 Tax=Crenobacter caeni TaxID=2705474 RepID=A0A6B2KTJ5_9NEIS|nr:response regulator transcription factor [Crenobacter caeni]NDV13565.1 response regulator transcription factor [Crenobacter caeni]
MKIVLFTLSEALADTWRAALGAERCWRVADTATLAAGLQPGQTVLVDLAMPGVDAADWPVLCARARVVALSSVPDNAEGVAWLGRGAAGYAHAYSTEDVLRQVVATVEGGASWVGRELLAQLCRQLAGRLPAGDGAWRDKVTAREAEVVAALRRGLSNKEIARELEIAERTVKAHLSHLFEKFGVEDRLQLLIKLG